MMEWMKVAAQQVPKPKPFSVVELKRVTKAVQGMGKQKRPKYLHV